MIRLACPARNALNFGRPPISASLPDGEDVRTGLSACSGFLSRLRCKRVAVESQLIDIIKFF